MDITIQEAHPDEYETILPILHDADEDDGRIRNLLLDGKHITYIAYDEQRIVGAVTMRWEEAESEIEYIAVHADLRGQGYGTALVAAIVKEAATRNVTDIIVGTDNTSLENIAFYQRCGFRMDAVRRDFFSYIQPPVVRNGIQMQDMLLLRCRVAHRIGK
ncbi:MAG TPA: GNAT family N-acetyltransferase [Dictyobacter sp.]|jgi:ribosomal protein S18 acetylase RimI-like enzyme|nr:GNAT family N-acetyltransferase [Dictyobacter sp.]